MQVIGLTWPEFRARNVNHGKATLRRQGLFAIGCRISDRGGRGGRGVVAGGETYRVAAGRKDTLSGLTRRRFGASPGSRRLPIRQGLPGRAGNPGKEGRAAVAACSTITPFRVKN
jgi:hypothetical protein